MSNALLGVSCFSTVRRTQLIFHFDCTEFFKDLHFELCFPVMVVGSGELSVRTLITVGGSLSHLSKAPVITSSAPFSPEEIVNFGLT